MKRLLFVCVLASIIVPICLCSLLWGGGGDVALALQMDSVMLWLEASEFH